jgi:hypothetical protein
MFLFFPLCHLETLCESFSAGSYQKLNSELNASPEYSQQMIY